MCTTQPNPRSENGDDDDIWADSSDDGHLGADHRELGREAAARHQHFYNAGYRDGMEEGKERTLQEGFNIGFREGAAAGFDWGLLRGAVKTLGALDGQAAGTRGLRDQIQDLQKAADVAPRNVMLAVFRHALSSPLPSQQQEQQQQQREQQQQQGQQSQQGRPQTLPPAAVPRTSTDASSVCANDPRDGYGSNTQAAEAEEVADLLAQLPSLTRPASTVTAAAVHSGLEAGASTAGASAAELGGPATSGVAVGTRGADRDGDLTAHELGATEQQETESASSAGGSGRPAAAGGRGAISLPPDAAALDLPDVVALLAGLRGRLADLGFEVGTAPPQSTEEPQPAQQPPPAPDPA